MWWLILLIESQRPTGTDHPELRQSLAEERYQQRLQNHVTATSVTTVSVGYHGSLSGGQNEPIIVLQEEPVTRPCPQLEFPILASPMDSVSRRGRRYQRRQTSVHGMLQQTLLTAGIVETIVMSNAPLPSNSNPTGAVGEMQTK